MGDDVLGLGLIGCGMIGQIHADGFAKLVADGEIRAVAAADPSDAALAAVARNCAFDRLGHDAASVIDDPEVDIVVITSPTTTHHDLVAAAVAAGTPMLCEKPLAADFGTVRAIHDLVVGSGLVTQVGFHSRIHPLFGRLHGLVGSGELGAPMGYVLREDQYWPTGQVVPGHSSWRSDRAQSGGGALLEHTIHGVDLLCWMFGPAVRVSARTRDVFGYGVEDVAALVVEHADGTIGTIVSVFHGVRGREERRLEVFFERGTVEVTADFVVGAPEEGFLVQRPDEAPERPDLPGVWHDHLAALGVTRDDVFFPIYLADRAFVHSARAGTPATPGVHDALVAHALVEAAYRSAASGTPVDLTGDLAV